MADEVLGREVVEFASKGVLALEDDINRLKGEWDDYARKAQAAAGAAAKGVVDAPRKGMPLWERLQKGFNQLAEAAQKIASVMAGIALPVIGVAVGAARGTAEGAQFSRAVENLIRVLGDAFGPVIRELTASIIELTTWYRRLSPETRQTATKLGIMAVILAAVASVGAKLFRFGAGIIGFVRSVGLGWGSLIVGAVAAGLGWLWSKLGGIFEKDKEGLHPKLDVHIESLQGTWERLLKGLAMVPDQDVPKAQLGEAKKTNEHLQVILAGTGRIGDFLPAVR